MQLLRRCNSQHQGMVRDSRWHKRKQLALGDGDLRSNPVLCIDMRTDMCVDMCIDVCMGLCNDMRMDCV